MNTTTTIDLDRQRAEFEAWLSENMPNAGAVMRQVAEKAWQAAQQVAREQQEPFGYVYGDEFYQEGNLALSPYIRKEGRPLYAAPVAQQPEAVAWKNGLTGEITEDPGTGFMWELNKYDVTRFVVQPVDAGAPTAAASPKDHEIREAINQLLDVAVQFHAAQQLRERIAGIVLDLVKPSGRESAAVACIEAIAKLDTRKDTVESCKAVAQRWLRDNPAGRESAAPVAEQDAKDAARYRFLREHWVSFSAAPPLSSLHWKRGRLDTAVDAAMQKGAQ